MSHTTFKPRNVQQSLVNNGANGFDLTNLAPMFRNYSASVPPEFIRGNTLWNAVVEQWFFIGLKLSSKFVPQNHIDELMAKRHISAVIRSMDPPHNVKMAIGAYLMSLWFKDFIPGPDEPDLFKTTITKIKSKSSSITAKP